MSNNNHIYWKPCEVCNGRGRKRSNVRKKRRIQYELDLKAFKLRGSVGEEPKKPIGQLSACVNCLGSGLEKATSFPEVDTNFPHIAIVGGGIGGVALAVACLHRGIPFTLFERDKSFDARSQGYGLTLQQASKAINGFGILELADGVVSKRHVVHTTDGNVIGEWGNRKWGRSEAKTAPVRSNVHIARQSLRLALLNQLGDKNHLKWGYKLTDIKEKGNKGVALTFDVNGEKKSFNADLVVGADGIRSTVRNVLLKESESSLNYLGCIVILGICKLEDLEENISPLLDSETVFQTVNGFDRMYMMPYKKNSIMFQFSFPIDEAAAIELNKKGAKALKKTAIERAAWHNPIPQILKATPESEISGYPVYDREILKAETLEKLENSTLIGDAAHPMSPFKGQGANQALLDALALAREINMGCRPQSNWREIGIRQCVLNGFEKEMLDRSAVKVLDSAKAAKLLHTDIVLQKADRPRGGLFK